MTWAAGFVLILVIGGGAAAFAYAVNRPMRQYKKLADECEGFDDPEERCPRRPEDCQCWKVRQLVEAGRP